jgi:hypothetical protein
MERYGQPGLVFHERILHAQQSFAAADARVSEHERGEH